MGHRGTRVALAVCAGLLGAMVGASPALAHNSFTGSNPEEGATVEKAPEEIELRFLEEVDAAATKISVTAPHGASGMKATPASTARRSSSRSVSARPENTP